MEILKNRNYQQKMESLKNLKLLFLLLVQKFVVFFYKNSFSYFWKRVPIFKDQDLYKYLIKMLIKSLLTIHCVWLDYQESPTTSKQNGVLPA